MLWFYLLVFNVLEIADHATGQEYKLTGSATYAVLGNPFTWTCEMFIPDGKTANAVKFYRVDKACALIGYIDNKCYFESYNDRYTYECLPESSHQYTLTLPAENMTEFEQRVNWYCEYVEGSYKSPKVSLKIAIDVHNVSLIPNYNPLTIREGNQTDVQCVVNSNALPAPTITWYLGSTDITNKAGTDTTSITITGNRMNNTNMLICKAENNNKTKNANTTLNVEYPPSIVSTFSNKNILEGENLSTTCQRTPGNPFSITLFWTKLDDQGSRKYGPTLQLPNINRTSSGTYRCTAENTFSNGEKGSDNKSMVVNVLYPPKVNAMSQYDIITGKDLTFDCPYTPGNPNTTTIFWTNKDKSGFNQSRISLKIPNIQKTDAGTYICTAENRYSSSKTGSHSQSLIINVLYPPIVSQISQLNIEEERDLSFNCTFTQGNPASTTIFWTSKDKPEFRQNGTTLLLPEIKRSDSGNYTCTAENKYSSGKKGSDSKSMILNVLYPPTMESKVLYIVNETETITLKQVISSNPLSNITWYEEAKLLKTETLTKTTTHTIQKAKCTDTKNFTLVASNGVGNTMTTVVEVIVNCKPRSSDTNITLGVTDTTGIDFSTTVIAYPQPEFELLYQNGTRNNQMMERITRNGVYNFTIHYNQTVVTLNDYGTYHVRLSNVFGEATVYVIVIPQRKPSMPTIDNFLCGVTSARVQWISSFDGGDSQWFTIVALNSLYIESKSDNISDKGINEIHSASVQNLKPSTMYVLYVSAQNSHGLSSSENISCTTERESSESLPLIAGGAAAGGLTLAVVVIAAFVLYRRYTKRENKEGKSQRFENEVIEKEEADVDGLKENSLYVSAGPRDYEKPEVAVYAAVAKKLPQGDNNSNLYADVKKSGRQETNKGTMSSEVKPKKGLFKKDGKEKHKKGKKPKNRPGEADVYENSEDIAMSTNVDNVYSNAAQKGQNKQKERGYKNKDGLLYVEVNFDGKQGQDNPVIHGEDEKTDYATVEFPMPSALHKASGSEEL